MRKITFMNLKGGVGKTTTAINMSMLLADKGYKVLLVDNDPQGNATKFFNLHSYDEKSMEDILNGSSDVTEVIRCVKDSLDLLPANTNIESACKELIENKDEEQHAKLKNALMSIDDRYDFCIIDCQPGMWLNTINALVATDDIIIPVKLDKQSVDGVEELDFCIEDARAYNPDIKLIYCLATVFRKTVKSLDGEEALRKSGHNVFRTRIRYSEKVDSWTYELGKSLHDYSPRCNGAIDYKRLVDEYLEIVGMKNEGSSL